MGQVAGVEGGEGTERRREGQVPRKESPGLLWEPRGTRVAEGGGRAGRSADTEESGRPLQGKESGDGSVAIGRPAGLVCQAVPFGAPEPTGRAGGTFSPASRGLSSRKLHIPGV